MSILGQLDAKRGADLGDGAAEHYAVPRRAGLDHAEPARARKGFDAGHVGGIGPMTLGVRLARQVFARLWRSSCQSIELSRELLLGATPHTQRHFEALVRMCVANLLGTCDRLLVAAREWDAVFLGH